MPLSKELLDILCCPKTRIALKELSAEQLAKINKDISEKSINYADGKPVDKQLEEGLITEDNKIIYRVDEEIPIMLIDMGIPAEQFEKL